MYEIHFKFQNHLFIEGNIPSSKNSKMWTGKHLIRSKAVSNYLKEYEEKWDEYKSIFQRNLTQRDLPLKIGFHFVRKTKALHYDWHNLIQLPLDLMQKYHWIADDDITHVIPIPMPMNNSFSSYNKLNSGVFIFY